MTDLALRASVPGAIGITVTELGGRRVVLARSVADARLGALDEASSGNLAAAAHLALKHRLPLVFALASSGADIHEGVAALHGWGMAARAVAQCSGVVPVLAAVTGPTVSGPALLLG